MEGNAERQVGCGQEDGPLELVEEEVDQPGLEDEGIEEHEEDDDDVEKNGDVLDAEGEERRGETPVAQESPALLPRRPARPALT